MNFIILNLLFTIIIVTNSIYESTVFLRAGGYGGSFKDFWHINKWICWVTVFAAGFYLGFFYYPKGVSIYEIIGSVIVLVLLTKYVWNYVRNNFKYKFLYMDETFNIPFSFGKNIDKWLGIHQQANFKGTYADFLKHIEK